MSDTDDDDASRRLARIARALDVPMRAFFDPSAEDATHPQEGEERELIGLFRALRDPRERRRCLDLVSAMVKGADG